MSEDLFRRFYDEFPEMRRVAEWKQRLEVLLAAYYGHIIRQNDAGGEGWFKVFRLLPDFETLRRTDQQYREKRPNLFPEAIKQVWRQQDKLWQDPATRPNEVKVDFEQAKKNIAEMQEYLRKRSVKK